MRTVRFERTIFCLEGRYVSQVDTTSACKSQQCDLNTQLIAIRWNTDKNIQLQAITLPDWVMLGIWQNLPRPWSWALEIDYWWLWGCAPYHWYAWRVPHSLDLIRVKRPSWLFAVLQGTVDGVITGLLLNSICNKSVMLFILSKRATLHIYRCAM